MLLAMLNLINVTDNVINLINVINVTDNVKFDKCY